MTTALKSFSVKLSDANILILGLAYKKNIDDLRESPSIDIINKLIKRVKNIDYSDPLIPKYYSNNKNAFYLKSKILNKKNIANYDLVLVCTDHDDFPYTLIRENAQLIIDTRNVYKNSYQNVIKA